MGVELETKRTAPYKEACFELGRFIDSLPSGPLSAKQQQGWERRREYHFEKYGRDSILSIFPKRLDKDYRFLVRATNFLFRAGILTKFDLVNREVEDIFGEKGIGDKTITLFKIMKNIASLETESQ